MEVSIIRVEGLQEDLNTAGCYVSVDNRLYDVITPLSVENPDAVELPSSGQLRLIIKNMAQDHDVIGSVSVSLQVLPESGFCWLPLYDSFDDDQVNDFDQEFQPPRVLVSINEGGSELLSKIDEIISNPTTPLMTMKMPVHYSRTGSVDELWITRATELEQKLEEERWKYMRELADFKETMLLNESSAAQTATKLREDCNAKDAEIAKLNDELRQLMDRGKADETSTLASQLRGEVEERDVEIGKLREVLIDLQTKQAELFSHEAAFSNFSVDELQTTLDDLLAQNNDLQGLYEQADNERAGLEDRVKDLTDQLEFEASEVVALEKINSELQEQVGQLSDKLKQSAGEPRMDQVLNCQQLDNFQNEAALLKLQVDELKAELKQHATRNAALTEELAYTQTSLTEETIKACQLMKDNQALTASKLELNRSSNLKDQRQADIELKELISRRGFEGVIRRKAEGEYTVADYTLRPYKFNGNLAFEVHGGMLIVEELIKIASKSNTIRPRKSLLYTMPIRRTSTSAGTSRTSTHRRTNTEHLDISLSERSKITDISCSSASKEDKSQNRPPLKRKSVSRPSTCRKENESSVGNRSEATLPTTRSVIKAPGPINKITFRAASSITPVRERNLKRVNRTVERIVGARVPFK